MTARLAPILKKELLEQDLWELYDQVEIASRADFSPHGALVVFC